MQVPEWWVWFSGAYIILSIIWTAALCIGMFALYRKTMPVLTEARVQLRRVSAQAKGIAAKASNTADVVHAQAQNLLGSAQSASNQMTRSAYSVGAAFTGLMVAARVINFVRKVF